MTRSVLDDIPGLGPGRRKRLLRELGGVGAVRDASFETLERLPWLPDSVALATFEKLLTARLGRRRCEEAGWDSRVVTAWWQKGFTEGADPEYAEQLLPLAAEHLAGATDVLDVGCGEGQVARRAGEDRRARRVIGVDPSWAQLAVASARDGRVRVAGATASALPFPSAVFDAVVVCLVLEHVADAAGALAEVGRVLRPGGRFVFLLNHPLLQTPGSGWVDDDILDEQYWRIGPYLDEDRSLEQVEPGIWLPYVHRPLSFYVNGLVGAGLVITHMAEPPPPAGFLAGALEQYPGAATIPRVLLLRAEKLLG